MNNNAEITVELNNYNEAEIENEILAFIQNIVNGFTQRTNEYLEFIYSESVNEDELFSTLNQVRLIQKLYTCSKDIINSYGIKQNSEKYTPLTKEDLLANITELKADTVDALKSIQKVYNESFDIDDEDEFQRVQSEMREKRKKFRVYDELLSNWLVAVNSYVKIIPKTSFSEIQIPNTDLPDSVVETGNISPSAEFTTPELGSEPEQFLPKVINLTEQAFFDWLVSDGCVTETTARQYISNIHSIEKLYQTIYGIRNNLFEDTSADDVKEVIDTLIQRNEYIDANERRHNGFGAALNKYVQFVGISDEKTKAPAEKKNYHPPISSDPLVVKTVDFENPYECTYYKPCAFYLFQSKYLVSTWRELYTNFLVQLYEDNAYTERLKSIIGKSLYGRSIDFADRKYLRYLRRPIKVSANFFAEGNISASDIIKRIKCLMDLCSIDEDQMVIEYFAHDKNDENLNADNSENISDEFELSSNSDVEQTETETAGETSFPTDTIPQETSEIAASAEYIVLKLNGSVFRAYDCSDALNKVCEFAINCKPFSMARIAGQGINLNGRSVFYRQAVPLDGYNKLSNGLQVIRIASLSDLQTVKKEVLRYCQIDDNIITII